MALNRNKNVHGFQKTFVFFVVSMNVWQSFVGFCCFFLSEKWKSTNFQKRSGTQSRGETVWNSARMRWTLCFQTCAPDFSSFGQEIWLNERSGIRSRDHLQILEGLISGWCEKRVPKEPWDAVSVRMVLNELSAGFLVPILDCLLILISGFVKIF